ncbi:leupeptin-inactivating enzyme 1 precursor [Ascobolus immersus RN42]|uniref:Peptide hydrolase n=1 Tax=Ascobolus immersus RN42 TaxID=1160509 RepID=A0A3N4HRY7_ASCIM|nr:leupeptin-inactivating enzyme 1 precursor [Ascobolus immersus RN42]
MKFTTLTTGLALASVASATIQLPLTPLVTAHIKTSDLSSTLKSLYNIALANGGNRAFGLPGYKASVDHILAELKKYKRTLDITTQEFPALFAQVEDIELYEVDASGAKVGDSIYVYGLTYSPSTDPEGLTGSVAWGPDGLPGCSADGYADQDVKDKIVLTSRFRCPDATTLAGRVKAAVAAGAKAVIVYNDVPTKVTAGSLSAPDPVNLRPAGFINADVGNAFKTRIQAGEDVRFYFRQIQTIETRNTWNVMAETKKGDPNAVIAFGGHLDSVQAGPGINDDGSGSALVLALAKAASFYRPNLKLRFHWWGAEENGLLGSEAYVASLSPAEKKKIRAYLNFDMVSRGYFGVFDGDGSTHGTAGAAGSGKIEEILAEYLSKKEKVTVQPAVFTGGSDYASFMSEGIPVGGLHTGTGVEQDPCYHQECDTFMNANLTVLTKNAKAAAYAMARLGMEGKKLIPEWYQGTAEVGVAIPAGYGVWRHKPQGLVHRGGWDVAVTRIAR